jgi:predicted signal transduction protein with EAL and GGDEF domain
VTFSQNIGAKIVAEGVETSAELATLKQLGAHCAQGYHLQPPKPISALSHFLVARRMDCTRGVTWGEKAAGRAVASPSKSSRRKGG